MFEVPERMKHLDRDKRGYPIPWIVLRDDDNQPHFTINDTIRVMRCTSEDRCSICGVKLLRGRWFIGGPGSALHEHGAYIDPPLHYECMQFAASVCPYLVRSNYTGRIDAATLDPAKAKGVIGFQDNTMDPTRPDLFVAVMAVGQTLVDGYIKPKRPYRKMEFWKDGKMIEAFDADAIAQKQPQRRLALLTGKVIAGLMMALLVLHAPDARAGQDRTYYGSDGRVVARSATDSRGNTTTYGADGRVETRSTPNGTVYGSDGRVILREGR